MVKDETPNLAVRRRAWRKKTLALEKKKKNPEERSKEIWGLQNYSDSTETTFTFEKLHVY